MSGSASGKTASRTTPLISTILPTLRSSAMRLLAPGREGVEKSRLPVRLNADRVPEMQLPHVEARGTAAAGDEPGRRRVPSSRTSWPASQGRPMRPRSIPVSGRTPKPVTAARAGTPADGGGRRRSEPRPARPTSRGRFRPGCGRHRAASDRSCDLPIGARIAAVVGDPEDRSGSGRSRRAPSAVAQSRAAGCLPPSRAHSRGALPPAASLAQPTTSASTKKRTPEAIRPAAWTSFSRRSSGVRVSHSRGDEKRAPRAR